MKRPIFRLRTSVTPPVRAGPRSPTVPSYVFSPSYNSAPSEALFPCTSANLPQKVPDGA